MKVFHVGWAREGRVRGYLTLSLGHHPPPTGSTGCHTLEGVFCGACTVTRDIGPLSIDVFGMTWLLLTKRDFWVLYFLLIPSLHQIPLHCCIQVTTTIRGGATGGGVMMMMMMMMVMVMMMMLIMMMSS